MATVVLPVGILVVPVSPASATEFNWPSGWTNPAGSATWQDWNYNECGYVVVAGQQWAHLGNDSQGYRSGPVKSIGSGIVKRVINAAAPDNGLMVEYQSSAGPFTLSYQHVNPGVNVGSAVVGGQTIGTVANWPASSNNHIHVSLIPGEYSSGTSWYGFRNCVTGAGSGGGHVNPIPWLTEHSQKGGDGSAEGTGGGGAIALGPNRSLILAAVKKDGGLYTRTASVGSGWGGFYKQSPTKSWADASIAVGSDGKYRLLATKKDGTLYYRIGTPGEGWSSFRRYGTAGSWAPGSAEISTGPEGTIALRAVKKDGTLYTRIATTSGGWQSFLKQGRPKSWSTGR